MNGRTRRWLLVALVVLGFSGLGVSQDRLPVRKKRVLFVAQSKGYQHESIPTAMVTLYQLGKESGLWETDFRTDCVPITKKPLKYGAKNLNDYDAVVFFTDGTLDLDDSQKADLISFVRDDGKGFFGIHSATITLLNWPEYGEMIGGYFDGHPWGTFNAPFVVEDPTFPGLGHLPRSFTLQDEIYQIKNYSRDRVRVLVRLDAGQLDLTRKGVHRQDGDFAVAWSRSYGKGRVLYNGMGHQAEVWEKKELRTMWLEMTRWTLGLTPGETTPRPLPPR